MFMLKAPAWQAPLVQLIVGDVTPENVTVGEMFGSDISQLVKQWIDDSFADDVEVEYTSGSLRLKTGGIPYFNGLRVMVVSRHRAIGNVSVKLVDGGGNKALSFVAITDAVLLETVLCTYIQASANIYNMEKGASANGIGLSTKERSSLIKAKAKRDRVRTTKAVFMHACQYPWIFNSSGLTLRAGDRYVPWISMVVTGDENASGLAAIVASGKSSVVNFYRRLYPSATTEIINDALNDSGLSDWFSPKFRTFTLKGNMSRQVQIPPFLLSMKQYPAVEAYDLMGGYLARVVARKVTPSSASALSDEFLQSLKTCGFKQSRSNLIRGKTLLHDVLLRSYSVDYDVDISQVISGSDSWADYCLENNITVSSHPAYWSEVTLEDGALSGTDDSGNLVSVDLSPDMMAFADMLVSHPSAFRGLLLGWEHFVAMVYSASFTDFVSTSSTYRMKSFRPLLNTLGITSGMMPEDIIGVIRNVN